MADRILVVDPDPDLRHRQRVTVSELGFDVIAVDGAEQAFEQIEAAEPAVILCDAFAPGTDDLDLVWQLARRAPEATLFVTSAPEDLEAALEIAIRGAHDHLSKPLRAAELRLRLRNARERTHLARQHRLLEAEIGKAIGERPIVAASSPMIHLLESVERAASDGRPVLLTGEAGTGKEVVARAIHALSSRRQQSFVALACAERSADAIRLELFGDPAARPRLGERSQRGLLRDLGSGTLYLDEVGALPIALQQELLALLRAQQDETAAPKQSPRNDVRIIAATAQRLDEAAGGRGLSAELLEQLGALRLDLPALRERRSDIPLLVDHFIDHFRRELAKPVRAIAEDALQLLVAYPWPGNIRELKNAIEVAVMLATGARIGTEDLPPRIALAPAPDGTLRADLSLKRGRRSCEIDIIRRALRATGGNRTHAARRLEISHRALLYKIKEYGIDA